MIWKTQMFAFWLGLCPRATLYRTIVAGMGYAAHIDLNGRGSRRRIGDSRAAAILFANPSPTGWRQIGMSAFKPFAPETDTPILLRRRCDAIFTRIRR